MTKKHEKLPRMQRVKANTIYILCSVNHGNAITQDGSSSSSSDSEGERRATRERPYSSDSSDSSDDDQHFDNRVPPFRWSASSRYCKCSKISKTFLFLFSNKMLVFGTGIHKFLVRVANWEDPDQTASSEAV